MATLKIDEAACRLRRFCRSWVRQARQTAARRRRRADRPVVTAAVEVGFVLARVLGGVARVVQQDAAEDEGGDAREDDREEAYPEAGEVGDEAYQRR